jgi:serine/threonine protein kinase
MRKHLPDPNFFKGKHVPEFPEYEIIELIDSGNNAHVFKAHSDSLNNDMACKIIPRENLIRKNSEYSNWQKEILSANTLNFPSVVKILRVTEWKDKKNNIDCVVLCSNYVRGQSLKKYIKNREHGIDINFIELFLKTMLAFLNEMERHHINHGDLHEGNILVEDRSDQLGGDNYAFIITDFGVATASSDIRFRDDYEQLSRLLRLLLQEVDYQQQSARNKFVYNILNDEFLARHFTEKDTTRNPLARNPRKLFERLQQIDDDFNERQQQTAIAKLLTPFDYLSCEQIGESHSLLKALYSDLFLGLSEIESRSNLVLTGPRGCGKSTVFKSLSLRHRYLVEDDELENINYIGIYYRCDDLYSAFPRYKLPERQEAYDIPIHYLTATLACEVLSSIELWGNRYFRDQLSKKESKISALIWKRMKIQSPQEPGAMSFKAIISRLQKERLRAQEKQRFVHDPKQNIGYYFGPEILPGICEILIGNLSFIHSRPFYFFIDDYSMPKITEDLQKSLNRLLMQRTSVGFFKLSTESPVSYCRADIDSKAYVEGREFTLQNLGLVYLSADSPKKLRFIEDIFVRRFASVDDYPVNNLDALVGNYDIPSSNETALAIRNKKKTELCGKQVLCKLCSGDIFYIIELVGKMVSEAGDTQGLTKIEASPKINKNLQWKAIRKEAGLFLDNLRRIEGGEQLVKIVTAFGNVAHSYLKYRNSKNEANNPPYQASRIEPVEELNLCSKAQTIYKELLRYSLFIEDPRGKSIRGKVVPRLHLRRSLLPHFKLTFSTRDPLSLGIQEIEELLLDPVKFEKRKSVKDKEEKKKDIHEAPLFRGGKHDRKD